MQKSSEAARKSKTLGERFKEYRQTHRDDISRIYVLALLSLVSALILQGRVGIDHFLGSFLLTVILLFIFYKDIRRYKPAYLNNYKMLLLLGVLVVGTLLVGRVFEFLLLGLQRGLELPDGKSFIFGIPIPLGAMLVTLIFDFHAAIIFSFVISLLTGIWLDNPFYPFYAFIGSLTAAFSVIRCKKRSALIKGGLYISGVNVATAGVILLFGGDLFSPLSPSAFLFAAMCGINVVALVSFMLPAIEYFFGIATDISLIELLDLDHPLMRSLMIAAPGTYHHSVIVGNLAESAAEAVGANPLLARVTAYYHDIGKIKMSDYFVENQRGGVSKHEKLAPHLSGMILINHVKEGVELAKQYKFPKSVTDIIQQHHGTSLIVYFFQKALEQEGSDVIPSQASYRYPGPKPQTRVAALVMMADAVEAASHTLTDPTPARIVALVEKIINNIFLDGQIDECELTLKDISEIKKRFTYILTSIFHRRIEYPELALKGMAHKPDRFPMETGTGRNSPERISAGTAGRGNGNHYKEQSATDKDKPSEDRETGKEGSLLSDTEGKQ
ncbi:MAG: HDIG domain-containing protein [Alphaproteobacteria bacterium]|uniref:HDIG domain-containing protein n=1 Tax=Candidatus Nitrobium versatile TaxID=2884831 RepID=A0A953JDN0_9BACT|nr:HDIG domain-containing protein [Candidatus Nitrobium versatile]